MKHSKRILAALTTAIMSVSTGGISAAAMVPPAYFHHSYQSAEEMADSLQTTFTPDLIERIEEQYYTENAGGFEKALALWRENGVPVPCFKGEPMGNGLDGGKALNFYISDLFGLPAVYYHPALEDWDYIVVQYLEDEQVALAQENGICALMDSLNPYLEYDVEYPSYYDREEITLNVNGTETPAIVGRELDDERSYFHFVYDNLLIKAACTLNPNEDPDDLFRWLSFEKADGELAVVDAVALQKYLLCGRKLDKAQHKKLDMTNDSVVNAFDLAIVKKKLIEKRVPEKQPTESKPAEKLAASCTVDVTAALSNAGLAAMRNGESFVLRTTSDIEEKLGELLGDAVVRSFKKTYDEAFFAENTLLFAILPLGDHEAVSVDTADVTLTGGTLQICYSYSEMETEVQSEALVQVAVAKSDFDGDSVEWVEKDAQPVSITLETESVYTIAANRVWDDAMIRSAEELKRFLSQSLTEDGTAVYAEKYPAEFFEENALYMELAWGHAPGYTCNGTAMKKGGTITINAWTTKSYGCVEQILHTAVLDKKDAEDAQVVLRKNSSNADEMHGEYQMISSPDGYHPGVYANVYQFRDEYEMEIGWLLPGTDCTGYLADKVISVPQEDSYMPFAGNYEYMQDDDGNEICIGENFEVYWMFEEIVIKYKPAENSDEMKILKLDYPWN